MTNLTANDDGQAPIAHPANIPTTDGDATDLKNEESIISTVRVTRTLSSSPTFEQLQQSTEDTTELYHDDIIVYPGELNDCISTEEKHQNPDVNAFCGPYADIRRGLDYSYHKNYAEYRQGFQNALIEDFLEAPEIVDKFGYRGTTPTKPWLVFTAGAMGAGKGYTIHKLVSEQRFPLLSFVKVDPDEIRRYLPEYSVFAQKYPLKAGDLTRKEAGFIAEILTLAGLRAGKNVLVDGSLRDWEWYKEYFEMLRRDFPSLKIAILHIKAPAEAVFQRAEARAKITGRVVPRSLLEQALKQVPESVKILGPLVDYFCELNNAPGLDDIELLTPEETWETFSERWKQVLAWVPGKKTVVVADTATLEKVKRIRGPKNQKDEDEVAELAITTENATEQSIAFASFQRQRTTRFCLDTIVRGTSLLLSTEQKYASMDHKFYGPNAHLRKQMDYTFHANYMKERQWLQDSIMEELIGSQTATQMTGDYCLIPKATWMVFVAGVTGAGKHFLIDELTARGRFQLLPWIVASRSGIRMRLPESALYVEDLPDLAISSTKKEVGYIQELMTLKALHAGRNVVVMGTLGSSEWYEAYFQCLKERYPSVKIAIIHVTAPIEDIYQRIQKITATRGVNISIDETEHILRNISASTKKLGPLADYYCEILNPEDSDFQIMTENEDWESFQQKFVQECAWEPGVWKKHLERIRSFDPQLANGNV